MLRGDGRAVFAACTGGAHCATSALPAMRRAGRARRPHPARSARRNRRPRHFAGAVRGPPRRQGHELTLRDPVASTTVVRRVSDHKQPAPLTEMARRRNEIAVWKHACPTCHAGAGKQCQTPDGTTCPPHRGRLAQLPEPDRPRGGRATNAVKRQPKARGNRSEVALEAKLQSVEWRFSCPHCGARIGEPCRGPDKRRQEPHAARLAKSRASKRGGAQKYGSLHTIPGGGFETNRRRH
jgi:hypothetical protein